MNDNSSYELSRVFGTAFVTLGIVIVIYMFGMSVSSIVSKYNGNKEITEAMMDYTLIEQAHEVYDELDSLYAEGNIEEMYNLYYENVGKIDMNGYRRYALLSCLRVYYDTVDDYDRYTDDSFSNSYSTLASFLYSAFSMVDEVNYDEYKSLRGADKALIDSKIEEVKGYIYEIDGLEGDELTNRIAEFKYQGRYHVEYSKVIDYAKERWGE